MSFSLSLTFFGKEDVLAQDFELCEELNHYEKSELELQTLVFFVLMGTSEQHLLQSQE